jgi:hypothetical protein
MPDYKRYIFVCANLSAGGSKSCQEYGVQAMLDHLKTVTNK